jgi:chromosome segregation ATPase
VGGTVVAGLSAFGVAGLLAAAQKRFYERKDRRREQDETNEGKRIDADQAALKLVYDRLDKLEREAKEEKAQYEKDKRALNEKLEKLTEAHNQLIVKNAELQKDAEHNEKEIERQAGEILTLRQSNHSLRNEVQQRDAKMALLEARIAQLESLLAQYQTGGRG